MTIDGNEENPRSSRRSFLKIGAGALTGAAIAAATLSQVPLASATGSPAQVSQTSSTTSQPQSTSSGASSSSQSTSTQSQLTTTQEQSASLQTELDTLTAFVILNPKEQLIVEALAESMLPSDSNGPGAKEAGVVYFIDSELAGVYGFNAKNYMQGPYVQPNASGPITVQGITYPAGTPTFGLDSGFYYQHPFQLREFWRSGLLSLEAYSNQAYGGDFETLTAAQQAQVITDLWANKPTNFTSPTPIEFISEVQEMVWAGFVTDPIHGGNRNMVGWTHTGFNGTNQGNFYGEGYTTIELMVMSTPVRLQPASLGQLEKGSP